MNPLLISGFGTTINVENRRLIINNKLKKERIEFLPHQIPHDSIVIDGHTGQISFEAMRWLAKHDIPITLLNWDGNLLLTANPPGPTNGKTKIKQYSKYVDDKERSYIADQIIKVKISHSLNLLRELSRYHEEIDIKKVEQAFANEYSYYLKSKGKSRNNSDFHNLQSYEGKVAIQYWNNLQKVINKLVPDFNFQSRRNKSNSWNMNASDEVNALLNFGYSLLEAQVRKCVNTVGLDPTVGYVHELHHSKMPLVYDLQELFRWVIDLSVIQMLEEKKLKKIDFITTENYHIRLREHTAQMLIARLKLNFNMSAPYKNKNYAYEHILMDNVQQLANYIMDKSKDLKFDIPEVKLSRDDGLELREFIMNMRPDERRKLGINRNTLWYMRENLKKGKKIKVYDKVKSKMI